MPALPPVPEPVGIATPAGRDQLLAVLGARLRARNLDPVAFLARAVRYLAGEAGIRQFLGIGTGLPPGNNTHGVAQAAPESRIVYVDNDPMVLSRAQVLLTSAPEGARAYLHADLHGPAVTATPRSSPIMSTAM